MNAVATDLPILFDPRWARVVARDASADGVFFYSVATTGVYCRPSCAARRANPANVRFHLTAQEAEAAGFRPCLRCKPAGPSAASVQAAWVTAACRAIEAACDPVSLADLAREAGFSPHYFHRVFRAATGLTPLAYAATHRAGRMRELLAGDRSITEAIHEAGYGSSSRFYEKSSERLGMTPSQFRAGGQDSEIRFAVGQTSLGAVLVAATDRGICAIALGDDPQALLLELQTRFARARLIGGDADFERVVALVVRLIEAPGTNLDLPLDIRGTAFQQRVWQALREIPAGDTASYAEIAARIGAPAAARGVGTACAANPIAVAIPCHRVVRRDGGISGYAWGVERKRALLEREITGS